MAEEQQKREDENNEIKEMGTLNMKESGSEIRNSITDDHRGNRRS